jgi:hypothetical protein
MDQRLVGTPDPITRLTHGGTVNAAVPVNGNAAIVVAVHSQIHNHFNNERHLLSRKNYKMIRARSIQEWQAFVPEIGRLVICVESAD